MTLTNAINRLQLWQAELPGLRSWKLFSVPSCLIVGLCEGDYKNYAMVTYTEMTSAVCVDVLDYQVEHAINGLRRVPLTMSTRTVADRWPDLFVNNE